MKGLQGAEGKECAKVDLQKLLCLVPEAFLLVKALRVRFWANGRGPLHRH